MRILLAILIFAGCGRDDGGPDAVDPNTDTEDTDTEDTEDTDTDPPATGVLQFDGPAPTNLLMISIDTMRKDHLGIYSNLGLTPFLDERAAEGVSLDDHLQCSSWTLASVTCTLAGRTNLEAGYMPRLDGDDFNDWPPIPPGTPFLATALGTAGYHSILASTNNFLSSSWGNAQGYDEEYRPNANGAIAIGNAGIDPLIAAIDGGMTDPWFLHLHFMEPHAAYAPPDEHIVGIDQLAPWPDNLKNPDVFYFWRVEWPNMAPQDQALLLSHLELLYQGEIRTVDARIAYHWDRLDQEGLLDDTLVVFWNDHGEQLYARGEVGHGYQLHSEENDGFALFWAKNIVPGRYSGPTSAIDLAPTLLEALGHPIPAEMTGIPAGDAPDDRPRFAAAVGLGEIAQTVTIGSMKLHYLWNGELQLFDRSTDPDEVTDLSAALPSEATALWSELLPLVEDLEVLLDGPTPALP
jgi:arylsulfatase A-like enzyme